MSKYNPIEISVMTMVEVIETEITKLSAPELTQLRKWFMDFDSDEWDAQIEKDAVSGKLDALANEALEEYAVGKAVEI